jgi:arylsulfatase
MELLERRSDGGGTPSSRDARIRRSAVARRSHPFPRSFGRLLIGLLSSAVLLLAACGRPAPDGPDILLITIDTLRADRLDCYGGRDDLGQALCGVGESGTRFTWAFATAPLTVPSVASILTSTYPSEHGFSQWSTDPLRRDLETLAEVLAACGYRTAAFVSNPLLQRARDVERGFDVYDDEMPRRERSRPDYAERVAADATDAALDWLAGARSPWFVWIHYQDPHGPYEPPGAAEIRDPPGGRRLRVLPHNSGWRGIPAYQELPGLRAPASYARRYDDEIRYLDAHVGRLLETLDSRKSAPLVALTADHGEALGEDGYYFAHGHSVGLDQVRVPLLIRGPGIPTGVVSQPVSLLDVAPTLVRLAGCPLPSTFRGRPLLGTVDDAPSRPIFAQHQARLAVVVGDLYYARDLLDLSGLVPDRNAATRLRPLPPRTARLDSGGAAPGYRAATEQRDGGPLEALIQEFVASHGEVPSPAAALDEQTRARLRAMGYLSEGEAPPSRSR